MCGGGGWAERRKNFVNYFDVFVIKFYMYVIEIVALVINGLLGCNNFRNRTYNRV